MLGHEHTIPQKTIVDRWFRHCRQRTAFSDLALWRHHSWSMTSRERLVQALWRHIRRLFLHGQIGTKAIFTSEYQPWISISNHPVFTA